GLAAVRDAGGRVGRRRCWGRGGGVGDDGGRQRQAAQTGPKNEPRKAGHGRDSCETRVKERSAPRARTTVFYRGARAGRVTGWYHAGKAKLPLAARAEDG